MQMTRRAMLATMVSVTTLGAALPRQAMAATGDTPVYRLLMVEQRGCYYCEKWKHEIGPAYPQSAEARIAPLEFVDLRGQWPEGITVGARPVFTPTFILLKDGVEAGRLEGYAGEHFFWGLLDQMLVEAGITLAPDGVAVGMAPPKS